MMRTQWILVLLAWFSMVNPAIAEGELIIRGGENYSEFLGCITCSQSDADSIENVYGPYGNPYSAQSLLNQYSQFASGSSTYSMCNAQADFPPIVVDESGNQYGYLTINLQHFPTASESLSAFLMEHCNH